MRLRPEGGAAAAVVVVGTGIAPTGGTLLDLWMRQKSHYGLLWLADRSLSAAELHTKAKGRS